MERAYATGYFLIITISVSIFSYVHFKTNLFVYFYHNDVMVSSVQLRYLCPLCKAVPEDSLDFDFTINFLQL